jgi:hypothetical protein
MNYGPAVLMVVLTCIAVSKTTEPSKAQLFPNPPPPPSPNVPPPSNNILPPLEYDYPYQGKLTVQRVDTIEELIVVCSTTRKWLLGCARPGTTSCQLILVRDEVIRQYGWTTELMMRHEVGHCNGWPQAHPGQRPRWAPAGEPPAKPKSDAARLMHPVIRWLEP